MDDTSDLGALASTLAKELLDSVKGADELQNAFNFMAAISRALLAAYQHGYVEGITSAVSGFNKEG